MTSLALFIILAAVIFAAFGYAARVGTLRQVRELQKIPDPSSSSEQPVPPSISRLVMGVVLISITVAILREPHLSGLSTICVVLTPWGIRRWNRERYDRPLTKRDGFWIAIGLIAFGLFFFAASKARFPNFDRFLTHPAFAATLWAYLTGLFIWQWCALRRAKLGISSEQAVTV